MKILVTSETYYPLKDGTQNITQNHMEELARRGHEVTVITETVKGVALEEVHNKVRIFRIDISTKFGVHYGNKREYLRLVKDLIENNEILIVVGVQKATTDLILSMLHEIKIPKILYMHGKYDLNYDLFFRNKSLASLFKNLWYNLRWSIYYLKFPKYLKEFDKTINIFSEDSATEYCLKHNCKVEILNNFVETQFLNNKMENKENYIICVSNYSELKNQKDVLSSFMRANTKDYKMIFVGSSENSYLLELKKYASKSKKSIDFLTNLQRKDICELLSKSKLFLFASKTEKLPVVLLESMASKTPFISTNVGMVKFLPGGITVTNNKEMVSWINTFIDNENLIKKYGEIGKEYVEKEFSHNIQSEKLEQLLYESISNRKG